MRTYTIEDIRSTLKKAELPSYVRHKVYSNLPPQTLPKVESEPRPAFLGDRVLYGDTKSPGTIAGPGRTAGRVYVRFDVKEYRSEEHSVGCLTHPDGSPVSRIIEHRRPIPVSERLPTAEDANEHGRLLAFWDDGRITLSLWDAIWNTRGIVTWLPAPESGVE